MIFSFFPLTPDRPDSGDKILRWCLTNERGEGEKERRENERHPPSSISISISISISPLPFFELISFFIIFSRFHSF